MYDLFDTESANLIDWFDSLEEALASVGATIRACGVDAVATWALVPQDTATPPIRGAELIERALNAAAA